MRFLLYIMVIGLAVYLLIALIQRRGRRSGGSSPRPGSRPTPGPRPGRPVAPDDDPAFLAELDRQRRAAERKAAKGGGAKGGTTPAGEAKPAGEGTAGLDDSAAPERDTTAGSGADGPSDDPPGEPTPEPDGMTSRPEPDDDDPEADGAPAGSR